MLQQEGKLRQTKIFKLDKVPSNTWSSNTWSGWGPDSTAEDSTAEDSTAELYLPTTLWPLSFNRWYDLHLY